MNSTSFLLDQPCADTSYGHAAATPSFLPKSDFPQVGDSSSQGPVPAHTQDPAVSQGGTEDLGWPIDHVETWLVLGNRGSLQPAGQNLGPAHPVCGRPLHCSGELDWRSHKEGWGPSPCPRLSVSHRCVVGGVASQSTCFTFLALSISFPAEAQACSV